MKKKYKLKKTVKCLFIGIIFGVILTTILSVVINNKIISNYKNQIAELETNLEAQNKSIEELSQELLIANSYTKITSYTPDIESVEALAKTLWGECRGVESDTEKACVAWCILNRVDRGYGETVLEVVSAPNQFAGYNKNNPITTELKELAIDVLQRWMYEKDHPADYCGRVLPNDYCYFLGYDGHNWFTNTWRGTDTFTYNLLSPYLS